MFRRLIATVALSLIPASTAFAAGGRTATVEIYNGVMVSKSECLVIGKRTEAHNKGGQKLLKKIIHTGTNRTERYTVEVPQEFVGVRYQCRSLTKADVTPVPQRSAFTEQVISRQPLSGQGGKASCGSAAPDARCSMSVIGL